MDRPTGRQCRSHDQTDEAAPATRSMTPFRPTYSCNRDALPSAGDCKMPMVPPLGYCRSSMEEHRRLYDGARKMHDAVVASTTDAAANRHRTCLEERDCTSWLDLQWFSSSAFQPAVRKTISGWQMAVVKHRRVATTNTQRVCDGSAVNSEPPESYALHLSEKKTPGLQEVVLGDSPRIGGKPQETKRRHVHR
ncbi:hypothetical protein MTO96_013212 [Rhipicephalus appendiculatus]